MSEQVMISRELLERMRDLIYVLAHSEDSIGQDACSVGGHFPELLAQPVSAQPAGEVLEVVVWRCKRLQGREWVYDYSRHKACVYCEELMTVAQHTRIVAALQARAVVIPPAERCFELIQCAFGDYKLTSETGARVATSAALILDEVARLNGIEAKP
jgi:hypothetical protein